LSSHHSTPNANTAIISNVKIGNNLSRLEFRKFEPSPGCGFSFITISNKAMNGNFTLFDGSFSLSGTEIMRANALSVMSYLDDFYEDEESN